MTSSTMRTIRCSLALLAAGTVMAGAAAQAQAPVRRALPPGAVVQPLTRDEGAELRRHLNTLAANPRSVDALIGAGRAALDMNDSEAALSFFGRADELSPRNARVKAGMASALVKLGQPQAAIGLFAEAISLGAPEVEIAGDRGLALDMVGETRRAQQDYVRALRRGDDPELKRRLALSLAISGEQAAALRLIDAQLRSNDRAAWRVQAFVLALTGDAAGANRTAQAMMPGAAAQAMAPFFAALPGLDPAQKASAVHLGRFPSGAAFSARGTAPPVPADPAALAFALGGAPAAAPARTQSAASNVRRRARSNDPSGLERLSRASRRQAQAEPAQPQPTASAPPAQTAPAGTRGRWAGAEVATRDVPAPPSAPAATARATPEVQIAQTGPGFSLSPQGDREPRTPVSTEPAPASRSAADETGASTRRGLTEIAALVNALPTEAEVAAVAEPRPPAARRSNAARETRARPRAAQPAHPSRHWVQIAGGADRSALPREYARLRALAPDQLGRRSAYTTPLRATNRLLVGPFDSADAAQDFVNELARRSVTAFAWTSPAGQEIGRLQTGR